jgi:hypothetical protein
MKDKFDKDITKDYGSKSRGRAKIIELSKFRGVPAIDIEILNGPRAGRIERWLTPYCIDGVKQPLCI